MNISDKINKYRSIYYMSQTKDTVRLHWDCISEVTGLLDAISEKFCYGEEVVQIAFSSTEVFIHCMAAGAGRWVGIKEYMEFIATYGE